MGFISERGLLELKNYQYKSGGYSWLDNKMNPFWLFCVECVPLVMIIIYICDIVDGTQSTDIHRVRIYDRQLFRIHVL
jgi:hypothetical protein